MRLGQDTIVETDAVLIVF